jgi:hypothetical protein
VKGGGGRLADMHNCLLSCLCALSCWKYTRDEVKITRHEAEIYQTQSENSPDTKWKFTGHKVKIHQTRIENRKLMASTIC